MNFYQVFILGSGNYRRKNLIKDVIIHNSAPKVKKKLLFGRAVASLNLFFTKWMAWNLKESPFCIQNLKTELKNLAPIKSYVMALWKWYADFQSLHKKCCRKQNYWNLKANWYIFSKVFMVHYRYSKFDIFSISLSGDIERGRKCLV